MALGADVYLRVKVGRELAGCVIVRERGKRIRYLIGISTATIRRSVNVLLVRVVAGRAGYPDGACFMTAWQRGPLSQSLANRSRVARATIWNVD